MALKKLIKQQCFVVFIAWIFSPAMAMSATFASFSQPISGDLDNLSLSGWACEVGNSSPLSISLYAGNTRSNAALIATAIADKTSGDGVEARCLSGGSHRFTLEIPQQAVFDNSGAQVFVETTVNNQTRTLNSSATQFLPEHPDTALIGYLDAVADVNGRQFAIGWACQTSVAEPIDVALSTVDSNGNKVILTEYFKTEVIGESAINALCSTPSGKHRFRLPIPENAHIDFANNPLFVEAVAAFGEQSRTVAKYRAVNVPSEPAREVDAARKPNIVVFFTDDQGYADVGVHDVLADVHTPNIDALAESGALFKQGYITAPQCSPSRAAMITGIHQSEFRMDENQHIPMTLEVETLANRLKEQDYATGLFGKWHLEITNSSQEWGAENYPDVEPFVSSVVPEEERLQYFPHERGFDDVLAGYTGSYVRTMDLSGQTIPVETYRDSKFRVDLVSDMSLSFIDKHWNSPFYMHVAHYAPHVPLESPQKYLDLIPEDMPVRRRYALAMMAAVDDGIGRVVAKLEQYNLLENTIILFISDNGAPLGDDMTDAPISARETWNGSRNDPFTGEKGMLTEGAVRVPYIMHWPKRIQSNMLIDEPVSALDAAYTAVKAAGLGEEELAELGGMDLLPLIDGEEHTFMERPLFWRFFFQRAVRLGDWKYMQAGVRREYLFDMTAVEPESVNYINDFPEIAEDLRQRYWNWAQQQPRPEPLVEIPIPFSRRVDRYLPLPPP
ncbi:sulfatase-like hydrolase/transferase [Alteromonas sp. 5E99-2]|uniref:sulfatase family protein n=1 Tax=Alteromonas sp. 5E99-2 TaxID=2817683 RepID=UPI001A996C1F|nr:sulfatase-like hydrolase/transferase [Alteromonas sp. 5E99-2]